MYSFQLYFVEVYFFSQSSVFLLLFCQGVLCVLEVFKINTLGVVCQR